jgi:hypothetical protein
VRGDGLVPISTTSSMMDLYDASNIAASLDSTLKLSGDLENGLVNGVLNECHGNRLNFEPIRNVQATSTSGGHDNRFILASELERFALQTAIYAEINQASQYTDDAPFTLSQSDLEELEALREKDNLSLIDLVSSAIVSHARAQIEAAMNEGTQTNPVMSKKAWDRIEPYLSDLQRSIREDSDYQASDYLLSH